MTARPCLHAAAATLPTRNQEENVTTTDKTADHTAPARGEFCHRHFSWLCQAGQGKCQTEANEAKGNDQ